MTYEFGPSWIGRRACPSIVNASSCHVERVRWFQGYRGDGGYGGYLNDEGILRVEGLYVDTPLALIAVDVHPIVRLGLSRQFHLSRCYDMAGLRSTWPRAPVHHKTHCGRLYSRSAPMLTAANMAYSHPSGSSMSRRSRCARVTEG